MAKNVIVAQSGGPSPVINSSLLGVIEGCRSYPDKFGKIYGGWHGIEGVLREELIDISAQDKREISLLATTPAAGVIGTCRYKLRESQTEDFARILDIFKAHDIGYFFYIGGNDSMDTAHKISVLAKARGMDLVATGVPKTIDNDVGDQEFKVLDHTPGYGSVARYWAYYIQNANEENAGACTSDPVLVMQVMGRKTGFIPAAARLGDPDRRMPMQIYMPESGYTLKDMPDLINDEIKRSGRCIAVVSEGFDVGSLGEKYDSFGHIDYSASQNTVAQVVINYLNENRLAARGTAKATISGQDQRDTSIFCSTVDLAEAREVGQYATKVALEAGSGWMATILRKPGSTYQAYYDKVPLQKVALCDRQIPPHWLSSNKLDVTDDYVKYARPLIGEEWPRIVLENGIQRFARFKMIFADKKCPAYIPQGHR